MKMLHRSARHSALAAAAAVAAALAHHRAAQAGPLFSFENPINRRNLRLANRFVQLFDVTSDSVKERILFYSVGSRMIGEMPVLGSGPGTYRLRFYPFVERLVDSDETAASELAAAHLRGRIAEHAHNDYIELLVEMGALGGLLAFLFLLLLFRNALRSRADPRLPKAAAIRVGALVACSGLLLHSLVDFNLHIPSNALLFLLCACTATAGEHEAAVIPLRRENLES